MALFLVVSVSVGAVACLRAVDFVGRFGNPLEQAGRAIDPPAGSIAWKLRHGQQVNLLLLGYGGVENEAPYLTDTILVVAIDPAHDRAVQVSVPRDLEVDLDVFTSGRPISQKVNAAYAIGMDDNGWKGKRPEFRQSKDRGGRAAMQALTPVTGLRFDGFVAVDFKAFRDLVDALGGVEVCLERPLDDYEYPDYKGGYIKGGIHFRKGCQQINGEQALQLARSRHATQAEEASDFARAKRQQLVLNAIRKKAASVNAITKAPALMESLQKNFATNIGLADIKALYDFSGKLSDGSIGRIGISTGDFLGEYYLRRGTCGDFNVYTLCPEDPSYRMLKDYLAHVLVEPAVLKEGAPVQVANASRTLGDLGDRVSRSLQPLGLKVQPPVRVRAADKTVVYDYSEGKYPQTAQWLASYFGATVVAAQTPPTPNPPPDGFTVVLGHDYALRWIGQ